MSIQKLVYRFSLDTFKNGFQRIIPGHQTGEHTARSMEISLVSGAESYEFPMSGITANMYVKRPSQTSPSINPCTIDYANNKIIYQIQDTDIQESGIVECQLKIIDTVNDNVLVSPKFGIEVWESLTSDSDAEDTPTYESLTEALATVIELRDKSIKEIYIDEDNIFTIVFYDDTIYTSDVIADAVSRIDNVEEYAKIAEGYARGTENGEDVSEESPYYQNNAKYYSESAEASAQNASTSESNASISESNASASEANASASEASASASATSASTSATNAATSEANASTYATSASASATSASSSATSASESATSASESASSASASATDADSSATSASVSASSASTSATNASNYADLSESYAVGGTSTRQGEDTDNAKYYKERCEQIAGGLEGGILPMGTITFASLPTITSAMKGHMYNISDDFVSDSRFKDGGGRSYAAGQNVYVTSDLMWDCFAGSIPTINGKTGNSITLDARDFLLPGYTKATAQSAVSVNDTVSVALGKLEKKADDSLTAATSLDGRLTTAESEIDSLESRMDTAEDAVASHSTQLGGFSFVSCTQAEYDAMSSHDANTFYLIH